MRALANVSDLETPCPENCGSYTRILIEDKEGNWWACNKCGHLITEG